MSHNTSQKATTSSHTMWPESATRMCCAVTVQAHQPTSVPAPINSAQAGVDITGCNIRNDAQAQSVPTVPGAKRLRPAPAPNAMKWAGWANKKAQVGRARGAEAVDNMDELWVCALAGP